MDKTYSPISVCCFGEILWDVLPDGPKPGGAPLNVTYHLNKLGVSARLISRVGDDEDGRKLRDLMGKCNLQNELLQTDRLYDTSHVLATVEEDKEVSYEIVFPVAWDFIEMNASVLTAVKNAGYFVYGSLAARNEISGKTLSGLLEQANCKVLDINLRPPFYKREVLDMLLSAADILKVNQTELENIISIFKEKSLPEEVEQVDWIRRRFKIKEIIITKGARGASYYSQEGVYHSDGRVIKVEDTIGSGDAFLAAFLAFHSRGEAPETILNKATAMGAFIAGKKGGCPDYKSEEYFDFFDNQNIPQKD